MTRMEDKLAELASRRAEAKAMGGPERIARQHVKGSLTARERIDLLLDPGTFQEYGLLASHLGHKPGDPVTPADGVIGGLGRVSNRPIALYAEDATVFGGSAGEINLRKRIRIIDLATKCKLPFVALLDGAGYRAQEMLHATEGAPAIGHTIKYARHSGTAPLIALVMGGCAGEPALEAAMMEYCIMVGETGMLAAGGPPIVKASTGLDISKAELGGAEVHAKITGLVDNVAHDDRHAIELARDYLSYLPTNAWSFPPSRAAKEPPAGASKRIETIVPNNPKAPYDMRDLLDCILDEDSFYEIKPDYGAALLVGFARLNGHSIGVMASQPLVRSGALSGAEGQKARKFIDICNAYHVPLVSITDTPGVMTGPVSEREGALKYGLGAAYALAWADIPVFSVIIRKAFGFGGALMAGSMGPQTVALVWPMADFSSLPPDSAILAAHSKELEQAEDRDALHAELMESYQKFGGPYPAAATLNIDDVIAPAETRARLVLALETWIATRTTPPVPAMRAGVLP